MHSTLRLLQFTDSTFPVGTFSFSNGLETAAYEKIVHDKQTLAEFTEAQAVQAAFTDGIAALASYRAAKKGDYDAVLQADAALIRSKMNDEARLMLCRMGKKLAELSIHLFPDEIFPRWLTDIANGKTPGTYPVAQGLAFAVAGIEERELFASHQYGVINMVLGAALRCVRVSHFDTQEILFSLSDKVDALYNQVKDMTLDEMWAFVPQIDILASLHEKGNMRMFMN